MATTLTDLNEAMLLSIISKAPTATITELINLAQGSDLLTQAQIESENVAKQKLAKQAIITRAKELAQSSTDTELLGLLIGSMNKYVWYQLGHNVPVVQSMRKRCISEGNPMWGGIFTAYLDPNDSTKFESGADATAHIAGGDLDGTLSTYQVYVEQPKFYYVQERIGNLDYYAVALAPFEIKTAAKTLTSKTHPLFRKTGWTDSGDGTDEANERDFAYLTAFSSVGFDADNETQKTLSDGNYETNEIVIDETNDKLLSIANLSLGLKPATYYTRDTARKLIANATNKQYHWHAYSATRLLYLCEYRNHNSQETIGGYTDGGGWSYDKVCPNGATLSLGNKTGNIINDGTTIPTIDLVSTSAIISMSYRGQENIFGNTWDFCDGVNISDRTPFVCEIDATYVDDIFTGDYIQAGNQQATTTGYQSRVQSGSFFIESAGGSSNSYITDYYWQSLAWVRCLRILLRRIVVRILVLGKKIFFKITSPMERKLKVKI